MHRGLSGLLLIFGGVQVAVYLVPQRLFATCFWLAAAMPEAPATNANATTTVKMALRNSHNPPAMESTTLLFAPACVAGLAALYHHALPKCAGFFQHD
jgi:hypothetical protein